MRKGKVAMSTLSHVLWPAVSIIIVMAVVRWRHLSWRDDLGFRWSTGREALLWSALFVLLFILEELASRHWGIGRAVPWGARYSRPEVIVRVLAMVLLAPLAEELLFRGLLFKVISDLPPGPVGAVFITAALFALVHGQYYGAEILLVLADALFYGATRYATGSLLLPLLFHALGNLYAAYERAGPVR